MHGIVLSRLKLKLPIRVCSVPLLLLPGTDKRLALISADKPIAIAGTKRFSGLPDVPTMVEAGLPDVLSASWSAFLAPAGTPAPAIARLHEVIVAALRAPETTQRLTAAGFTIDASTPQELGATISAELARWKQVVKDANIQMN